MLATTAGEGTMLKEDNTYPAMNFAVGDVSILVQLE